MMLRIKHSVIGNRGNDMGRFGVLGWLVLTIYISAPSANSRTFDAAKGALYQPAILMGESISAGDVILHSDEVGAVYVLSDNIEFNDPDYLVAKCVLKKWGIDLPRSRNGVYWVSWKNFSSGEVLNGSTSRWRGIGGVKRHYSFIHKDFQGSRTAEKETFIDFMLTLYHEIKGHNVDDENHNTAEESRIFENRYEAPVRWAVNNHSVLQTRTSCMKH